MNALQNEIRRQRQEDDSPRHIGAILAELLAQYPGRFSEVAGGAVPAPAALLVKEDCHACAGSA